MMVKKNKKISQNLTFIIQLQDNIADGKKSDVRAGFIWN